MLTLTNETLEQKVEIIRGHVYRYKGNTIGTDAGTLFFCVEVDGGELRMSMLKNGRLWNSGVCLGNGEHGDFTDLGPIEIKV